MRAPGAMQVTVSVGALRALIFSVRTVVTMPGLETFTTIFAPALTEILESGLIASSPWRSS